MIYQSTGTDYQAYLNSITTTITGNQLISYTDIIASASTTPHYGYAQYTNYGGIQQFYGIQGKSGVTAFQCWEGTNPGCEVGVDASIFKKFADADPMTSTLQSTGSITRLRTAR